LYIDFLLVKLILVMEFIACWFLLVEHVPRQFLSPWNLCIVFLPLETDFARETFCVWIFIRWTCCVLIFVCETFESIYFILGFWSVLSLHGNVLFVESAACWFFVHETCCMCIFLFVKLVNWFVFLRNWVYLWRFLHTNFCSWKLLSVDFFCPWHFFHVDLSLCETCTLIFLPVKLILLIELVACWFFFSWNLLYGFFSSWNVLLVYSCLSKIFTLIFHVLNWFCLWILLRANFCSWNLLLIDFYPY